MSCNCHKGRCESKLEESKEGKNVEIVLYVISLIIFAITFIPQIQDYLRIAMYAITILLAGYEIILNGIKNIFKLNFEEDTLMTIAVVAACIIGEFSEGCFVILLFKLGEFIEERAVYRSNKSINKIVEIKAKNANLINGKDIKVVDVKNLKIGDNILIKPGEMIPVDCKVISGSSSIDTSNITGESTPVFVNEGTELLSGAINLNGSLKCVVTKTFADSTASQIVDLVYEAQNNKGKTEEFITRFSKIYTPVVIVFSILIAIVPAIFGLDFKEWLIRALVFLVASCPCSIVISIPLALYSCLGAISRKGMLIKGTKHIEDLANAKIIAFDKTGTLTTGKMEIEELDVLGSHTKEEILEYLYLLEKNSSHPIASAISNKIDELKLKEKIASYEVKDYNEIAGCGICGNINENFVIFGNKKLLNRYDIKFENIKDDMNYIALNGEVIGAISLKEEIRSNVPTLISELQNVGIKKSVILTGDNEKNALKVANELKIKEVYAALLPKEKLEKIELLKKEGKTIFVGDGINDSPVLATADFSISMGEGTEIANDTSDSILISNNLNAIVSSIKTSKKTMKILKTNIIFSLLVKAIVLIAGIIGVAPIWLAVFADVGITLITVLNSIRVNL